MCESNFIHIYYCSIILNEMKINRNEGNGRKLFGDAQKLKGVRKLKVREN